MSSPKYNVLLMRDDRPVRRMRLGRNWLRVFIYLQIFLLGATAIMGYGAYLLYSENRQLKGRSLQLEQDLEASRMQLERVRNMQRIRQAEVRAEKDEAEQPLHVPVDLGEVLARIDTGRAGLKNVHLAKSKNGLDVEMELTNELNNTTLNGIVLIEAVTRSGVMTDMEADRKDLDFSIQRYKRIKTTAKLPPDMLESELFGVRLSVVDPKGNVLFGALYPLPEAQ